MCRWFLNSAVGIVLAVQFVHADEPIWFTDDFADGDLHDGVPVSWISGGFGESMEAVSGDLVLTPAPERAAAVVEGADYRNASINTQMRVSTSGFRHAGLRAGRNGHEYIAGISGSRFGVYSQSLVLTYGSPSQFEVLASTPTNLDPTNTDVLLQFDVVGNYLSLFAWAEGTSKPARPQLDVRDGRIREGAIGMFLDSDSNDMTATFRDLGTASLQLPGDLNGDGVINFEDLTPFALALSQPAVYEAQYPDLDRIAGCDVNRDGQCGFADLTPFVTRLPSGRPVSPTSAVVPEPGSFATAVGGLAMALLSGSMLGRRTRSFRTPVL